MSTSELLERLQRSRLARAGIAIGERLRAVPLLRAFELSARRFLADGMPDRAASLAYYGLLSLLPSLMIAAAAINLLGVDTGTTDDFGKYLEHEGASTTLADTVESVMQTAVDSSPTQSGAIGLIGVGTLIYGASRVFAAAGRALDLIWRQKQEGLTVVRRAAGVGWTLLLLVLGLIAGLLTFVGKGLFEDILDLLGLTSAGSAVWVILRWPMAALAVMAAMRLVMWAAPSGKRGHFRLITPGAVVAASVWLTASAGYGIYVGEISSYNSTYGAFAALVILLLWSWLTSIAFLFGCEFDAVLAEDSEAGIRLRRAPAESTPPAPAAAPPPPAPDVPPPARSAAEDR